MAESSWRGLLKAFASKVSEFDDERLTRLVYGYGKLVSKRGLRLRRFFDFATSEIVQRGKTLKGWRKVRILEAVWHVHGASDEFRTLLLGQVMQEIRDLDAESFARFVPLLAEARFHERPGVIDKLNAAYMRKLRHVNFNSPDLVLRSGLPLLLHDLMKSSTLCKWLDRLQHLRLPLVCGATPRTPRAWHSEPDAELVGAGLQGAGREMLDLKEAAGADDDLAEAEADASCASALSAWAAPADAHRAASNLEALKVVEMCLRHERPAAMQVLSPRALQLLAAARQTPWEPPEDHQLLELPFVLAELGQLFRELGLLLHPTICGPYLIELADPLGQTAVEWDTNWVLYPPWRRTQHKAYVHRKHLHLKAEGWRVLFVPLKEFQGLENKEPKLELLRHFATQHGLQHLLVRNSAQLWPP